MTIKNENGVDEIDIRILEHLKTDGRMPMIELSKLIGMTPPSVTDRVRRLEDRGIIKAFTINLDLAELGYGLEAIVRIKPRPGSLHQVEQMIIDELRFTACDKVTGDDCFIARLALKSIAELDDILDPFHEKAETNTAIIKSSPLMHRQPQ